MLASGDQVCFSLHHPSAEVGGWRGVALGTAGAGVPPCGAQPELAAPVTIVGNRL